MNTFKRRIYSVPGFFHDIFAVLKNPGLAISAGLGSAISSCFRQRLYLAVISVNRCRYCTYIHTREALHAGLTEEDINRLLAGDMENVPGEELKAILYAQHWADNTGKPDPHAQAELIKAYGDKKARVIEMVLLLVQIGSLCGNSFDYILYRLSFGRYGVANRELS